jgi:hypothetical protein
MDTFFIYYSICVIYSFIMSAISWNKHGRDGGIGITPALDSIAIVILGPVLAPTDFLIRWFKASVKAESYRIRSQSI